MEGNLVRGYQLEIWKILIRLGKGGGGGGVNKKMNCKVV